MPFRQAWTKTRHWFSHLLHLDDSAHRIALGVAIGMFIALTPTMGIQMVLTFLVAALLGANKVSGVPMAWITNPLTAVPVYSFNYLVGHTLVGGPGLKEIEGAMVAAMDPSLGWSGLARAWWSLMLHGAAPLWAGCALVGFVAGVIAYAVMYYLITTYRRIHRRHLAEAAARAQLALGDSTRRAGEHAPPPLGTDHR